MVVVGPFEVGLFKAALGGLRVTKTGLRAGQPEEVSGGGAAGESGAEHRLGLVELFSFEETGYEGVLKHFSLGVTATNTGKLVHNCGAE